MIKTIIVLLALASSAVAAPVGTYDGKPIEDGAQKWGAMIAPGTDNAAAVELREQMGYESARNQIVYIFNDSLTKTDQRTTVTRAEFERGYADQIAAVRDKERGSAALASADTTGVLYLRFLPGARLRKITDNWTLKQLRASDPAAYTRLIKAMDAQSISGDVPLDRTMKFSAPLTVLNRKFALEQALPRVHFSDTSFGDKFQLRAKAEISAPPPAF